jgi:histidine triad (HIT) family protein
MSDCIFCKIVEKKIPSRVVHEDADTFAFEDLNPQAPVHVLIIPRRHVSTVSDLVAGDDVVVGKLYRVAAKIAADRGIVQTGYRIVANTNRDAGQTVFHLHLHLLGGRPMQWPPG